MRSTRFFLLAAWLCLSLSAFAQTIYYVGPEGTDVATNPGTTVQAPFETIGYAITRANANDIVQVLTGTYSQANILSISKPITIRGLGQTVTITPAETANITSLVSVAANGVTLEGLTFAGSANMNGIIVESITPEGIDNLIIRQNTISGFSSGIVVNRGASVRGLNILNNFINDNETGILINQAVQLTENSIVTENDLSNNEKAVINNSGVPNGIVNAQANWWGSTAASEVTLEITNVNRVTYSPWLNTEIDNSDEEGFQSSFISVGVERITSNLNALTDAYEMVAADGNITLYPSKVNNNVTYEAIIVGKSVTLATASSTLIPIEKLTTNGGNLIVNGEFKVNELELIDGNITTSGSNPLTITFGGNILENGTGQLIGEVKSDAFDLPANTPLNFLGVSISAGVGTINNLTISRTTGANAVATVGDSRSIEVLWDINIPNQTNISPRTLTFAWEDIYDGEMNFETLDAIVWKREDANSPWEPVVQQEISTESSIRSVTINNVTSFSEWIVSDEVNALPVELMHFSASVAEPHVELNWETASEINADYFSIERSENGKDFKEIGQLKAAGDSDTPLQYHYIDEQAAKRFSGSLFYRLRTVDFDESFEYSDITTVMISEDDIPMITAFARQGETSLKLFTRAIEPGDYHVWITDLSGRKIFEQDMQLVPKASYNLGVGNLPQSVYLIRCTGKQLALSTKFRIEEAD